MDFQLEAPIFFLKTTMSSTEMIAWLLVAAPRTSLGGLSTSANAMNELMSGHRDSYCEGSHGLSVGSLGAGGQVASVENVLFENTIMASFLSDEVFLPDTLYLHLLESHSLCSSFQELDWRKWCCHQVCILDVFDKSCTEDVLFQYNMEKYHIYRCDAPYFRDPKVCLCFSVCSFYNCTTLLKATRIKA